MQQNFSYSVKMVMYLLKSLVSKNIERKDYKWYVLFVDSYSENHFKIFFSHRNNDNEEPFWAGFHKAIYKQQEIVLRLTKVFSYLALIIFRKCVVNGMTNVKSKIKLCLLWDKVSPYNSLSSVVVGVVPFLKKIT